MAGELWLRILSALVLAAAALALAWAGGLWFRLAAALAALLIYHEWSTMARLRQSDRYGHIAGWCGILLVAGLIVAGLLVVASGLLLALVLVALGRMLLFRRRDPWLAGGLVYAALSGIALAAVRDGDQPGLAAILFVFATVWATDTFAYFTGRALGGPKLAPSISPGKTWSGAAGGVVAGVIAGSGIAFFGFGLSGWRLALIAFALSISGQVGDLFESFVKRRFGVKDSGWLIPGHGGVMDRLDGLVFACFSALLLASIHALASGRGALSVADFLFGP